MNAQRGEEKSMSNKIIVVCIEELNKKPDEVFFREMSAINKIKMLVKNIEMICAELKKQDPEALWVIGWREFAIKEGCHICYVSQDALDLFQKEMKEISNKYSPNLVILGSLASKEEICDAREIKSEARKVVDQYKKQYAWLADVEFKLDDDLRNQQAEKHIDIAKRILKNPPSKIDKLTNGVYVYQNGELLQIVLKKTPFEEGRETKDKKVKPHLLFQPPTPRSQSAIVSVDYLTNKQEITFGIEICREHYIGVLKKLHESVHLTVSA